MHRNKNAALLLRSTLHIALQQCKMMLTSLRREVDDHKLPLCQPGQLHHQLGLAAASLSLKQHNTATLGRSCKLLQLAQCSWCVPGGLLLVSRDAVTCKIRDATEWWLLEPAVPMMSLWCAVSY